MRALLLQPRSPSRDPLQSALEERGWQVERASTAQQALRRFRSRRFDLVVLDRGLPGDEEIATCRGLRACAPGPATAILAVARSAAPEAALRLVEAGADDCLAPPLSASRIAQRLAVVEGRLRRSAADPAETQERVLEESEARYRALFDQSPVGVFLCDAQLRITHCNERLTQILASPYEDIVGIGPSDLVDERVQPVLERASGGEVAFYEGPYRTGRRGRQLWISVCYAPLRAPDGAVVGGIGVLEDVSAREEAQRQLKRQAAELERVNAALRERTLELEDAMRARSRLYSAMNHELRTPISAIMLYQELLLARTLGPLAVEQEEALERSHTAARHLLALVQEMLDLGKKEAGTIAVHLVEISLTGLLRDLRATVLPLAQRFGSTVQLELEPVRHPVVTDPQRLRQIVLNLLSNAAKFGLGRPIALRCRAAGPDEVAIEVVDRGVGIAAADLPRIFEEFVQVGGAHEAGTGLGLAISRRLTELLAGRLEVESQPGSGSTFRLTLPVVHPSHSLALAEQEMPL